MPLQHLHEHEQQPAPLRTVLPQEVVQEAPVAAVASEPIPDAPRYDAAAVKQIIALAEQMQSHHRATLTPDEIEALGHEVGVEPEFIRRALAQMAQGEANTAPPRIAAKTSVKTAAKTVGAVDTVEVDEQSGWQPLSELTKWQRRLVQVPMALYFLLLPFTLGCIDLGDYLNGSGALLMYMIVPAVIAFRLGGWDKSYRFGALVGAMTGFWAFVSVAINNSVAHHYSMPMGEIITMSSTWIGVGLVLGLSGAMLRARLRVRQPLCVRVIVGTTD